MAQCGSKRRVSERSRFWQTVQCQLSAGHAGDHAGPFGWAWPPDETDEQLRQQARDDAALRAQREADGLVRRGEAAAVAPPGVRAPSVSHEETEAVVVLDTAAIARAVVGEVRRPHDAERLHPLADRVYEALNAPEAIALGLRDRSGAVLMRLLQDVHDALQGGGVR